LKLLKVALRKYKKKRPGQVLREAIMLYLSKVEGEAAGGSAGGSAG
jgi:hypothetical protein